jgi:hypothetical protein
MILEQYLNESAITTFNVVKPEPLSEANWITPDSIGLERIKADESSFDNKLSRMTMFAESMAFATKLQIAGGIAAGNNMSKLQESVTVLQENVVTDFFKKMVDGLKSAWQRMVTWFKNLFKSIDVALFDVNKSLKDIDKVLNPKDFKDFKHDAHKWKDSSIATTMGNKAKTACDNLKKDAEANITELKGSAPVGNDSDSSSRDANDKKYKDVDNSTVIKEFIAGLVGQSGGKTIEEAKDVIKQSYGFDQSGEEKGLDWKSMVTWLKAFKDNETLKKAQKDCDELYAKAIETSEKALSAANSAKGKVKADADNVKNANSWYDQYIRAIQSNLSMHRAFLNNYDTLMGTCIEMEKARFSEYRGTISKAIRYGGKKDN